MIVLGSRPDADGRVGASAGDAEARGIDGDGPAAAAFVRDMPADDPRGSALKIDMPLEDFAGLRVSLARQIARAHLVAAD